MAHAAQGWFGMARRTRAGTLDVQARLTGERLSEFQTDSLPTGCNGRSKSYAYSTCTKSPCFVPRALNDAGSGAIRLSFRSPDLPEDRTGARHQRPQHANRARRRGNRLTAIGPK